MLKRYVSVSWNSKYLLVKGRVCQFFKIQTYNWGLYTKMFTFFTYIYIWASFLWHEPMVKFWEIDDQSLYKDTMLQQRKWMHHWSKWFIGNLSSALKANIFTMQFFLLKVGKVNQSLIQSQICSSGLRLSIYNYNHV